MLVEAAAMAAARVSASNYWKIRRNDSLVGKRKGVVNECIVTFEHKQSCEPIKKKKMKLALHPMCVFLV